MVQSNHATRGITGIYPQGESVPNIVLIGVPDLAALNRVRAKLESVQIPHYCWVEPDNDLGFTAIATIALTEEEKEPLRNYRLWKDGRTAGQTALGVTPGSPANSPVVQSVGSGL